MNTEMTLLLDDPTFENLQEATDRIDIALEYGPPFFAQGVVNPEMEFDAIVDLDVTIKTMIDAIETAVSERDLYDGRDADDVLDDLGVPQQWRDPLDVQEVRDSLGL